MDERDEKTRLEVLGAVLAGDVSHCEICKRNYAFNVAGGWMERKHMKSCPGCNINWNPEKYKTQNLAWWWWPLD